MAIRRVFVDKRNGEFIRTTQICPKLRARIPHDQTLIPFFRNLQGPKAVTRESPHAHPTPDR
jgi:hypothetical protein